MVRLKVYFANGWSLPLQDFNSTMVRLKELMVIYIYTINRQFQFHYGTIKRQIIEANFTKPLKFQFHYGTIKRISNFYCVQRMATISIPLWYD